MKNSTIVVCADCHGEIRKVSAGDESWNVCVECNNIEQNIIEVDAEAYSEGIIKEIE